MVVRQRMRAPLARPRGGMVPVLLWCLLSLSSTFPSPSLHLAVAQDTGEHCEHWANSGECTKNWAFMLKSCPDACKKHAAAESAEKDEKLRVALAEIETLKAAAAAAGSAAAGAPPAPGGAGGDAALAQEAETLCAEKANLEMQLNGLQQQAQEQIQQMSAQLAQASESHQQCQIATTERDQLLLKVQQLTEQRDSAREQLASAQQSSSIEQYQTKITALEQDKVSLKSTISERDDEIRNITDISENCHRQLEEKAVKVGEANTELDEVKAALANKTAEAERLAGELAKAAGNANANAEPKLECPKCPPPATCENCSEKVAAALAAQPPPAAAGEDCSAKVATAVSAAVASCPKAGSGEGEPPAPLPPGATAPGCPTVEEMCPACPPAPECPGTPAAPAPPAPPASAGGAGAPDCANQLFQQQRKLEADCEKQVTEVKNRQDLVGQQRLDDNAELGQELQKTKDLLEACEGQRQYLEKQGATQVSDCTAVKAEYEKQLETLAHDKNMWIDSNRTLSADLASCTKQLEGAQVVTEKCPADLKAKTEETEALSAQLMVAEEEKSTCHKKASQSDASSQTRVRQLEEGLKKANVALKQANQRALTQPPPPAEHVEVPVAPTPEGCAGNMASWASSSFVLIVFTKLVSFVAELLRVPVNVEQEYLLPFYGKVAESWAGSISLRERLYPIVEKLNELHVTPFLYSQPLQNAYGDLPHTVPDRFVLVGLLVLLGVLGWKLVATAVCVGTCGLCCGGASRRRRAKQAEARKLAAELGGGGRGAAQGSGGAAQPPPPPLPKGAIPPGQQSASTMQAVKAIAKAHAFESEILQF